MSVCVCVCVWREKKREIEIGGREGKRERDSISVKWRMYASEGRRCQKVSKIIFLNKTKQKGLDKK